MKRAAILHREHQNRRGGGETEKNSKCVVDLEIELNISAK